MRNTSLIALTLSSSVLASVVTTWIVNRQQKLVPAGVLRVKRIDLVGDDGQVLGSFGLNRRNKDHELPELVLRGPDGRDAIQLHVDPRGDGQLAFGNDYWPEGALILGHLTNVDDGTDSTSPNVEDKTGSWGLRVRSRDSTYTSLGFFNSGQPMTPLVTPSSH